MHVYACCKCVEEASICKSSEGLPYQPKMYTIEATRDDETTCNTAATINSCSLFAVSVSNDQRVSDAASATHETVYSKVVHPSLSVHDSAADYYIAGSSVAKCVL